jgi:replicative DNA helicase
MMNVSMAEQYAIQRRNEQIFYDMDIEKSVIAGLLVLDDGSSLRTIITENLQYDDIYNGFHQKMYEFLIRGKPDLSVLVSSLKENNIEDPGTRLANIMDHPITTDPIASIQKLRELAAKRKIYEVSQNLIKISKNGDKSEILAQIEVLDRIFENQITENQILSPLKPENTKIMLNERPICIDSILDFHETACLPAGIVGAIFATGGTGKSFLLILLAYILAGGLHLPPFRSKSKKKTLLLAGEDPQTELDRRAWDTCSGIFPDYLYIKSVSGKVGPLMELQGNKPIPSQWYRWLEKTVENHKLDCLIIDPKSRFYGLDENNNDHATQWIHHLEKLAIKYNCTVLFSHHVPKNNEIIDQAMSRGASALVDGCRWAAGMQLISEEEAKEFLIDRNQFIKFRVVKSNLTPKTGAISYFKRDGNGCLRPTILENQRSKAVSIFLSERLENETITKRDLISQHTGQFIRDDVEKKFGKINRKNFEAIIDYGLEKNILGLIEHGDGRHKKTIII